MKTPRAIAFEFVDVVPSARKESKLYVSIKYRTAIHSCFCGCGMKVVTPIRPTGWRLAYDGDTVSLHPSVGNWSFACQSHYWITNNQDSGRPDVAGRDRIGAPARSRGEGRLPRRDTFRRKDTVTRRPH